MKKHFYIIALITSYLIAPHSNAQSKKKISNSDSSNYDANSYVINNDTWWKDNNGDTLVASMGGHITKFKDTYYWIGNDQRRKQNGYDLRLYSSKTLGSNSWKFETIIDDRPAGALGNTNSTILFCPTTNKYVIITKGIGFYQSKNNDITSKYEFVKKIKNDDLGHPGYHTGGMSAYYEGNDAYIIVSLRLEGGRDRYCGIWKLTPDFLNIEKEIAFFPTEMNREAYWLFKKDSKYYMTYDGPGGWMASDCYFRTADGLAGPWSEEKDIIMDPAPSNKLMRSHASQSRWMINVDGQWMYGGDRYPYIEPKSHPPSKGLYVWCPVIWDGETPIVKFEKSWSVKDYQKD